MQQLPTLAAREMACLRLVEQNQGFLDVLNSQLEAGGVFDEYLAIHRSYADLLATDSTQEALKRALFIQWYSLSTPSFCSGIGLLDPEAELHVLTQLEQLLEARTADAELTCMLQYYAGWDYVFTRLEFEHLTALQAFIRPYADTGSYPSAPPLRMHYMPTRGGMGDYWLSWGGGKLLNE